ncbi:UPF0149 family protein [Dongshaea marina]|uniref:UPF0149 family protein n=1 Tax=Dongshaea marina TaxID=2047966 RepID=UPI000D3EA496|nr:UPF0149 family protein [Dongshaea marina]
MKDLPEELVPLAPEQIESCLRGYFDSDKCPEQTLGYDEMIGFFTLIATSFYEEFPGNWMAEVLAGDPNLEQLDDEQASEVLTALISAWNQLNQAILDEDLSLFSGYHSNALGDEGFARIERFSRGFVKASQLANDGWDERIKQLNNPEVTKAYHLDLFNLTLWADLEGTRSYLEQEKDEPVDDSMFVQLLGGFNHSLQQRIQLFNQLDAQPQNTQPVRTDKVGRNDPCPCGSGKKYKKCCMPS